MSEPSSPELTAEEREAITRLREDAQQALEGMCEVGPEMPHDIQCMYHEDCQRLLGDINTVDTFLTRTQSPPDTVRLEKDQLLSDMRDWIARECGNVGSRDAESDAQDLLAIYDALARAAKKEGE